MGRIINFAASLYGSGKTAGNYSDANRIAGNLRTYDPVYQVQKVLPSVKARIDARHIKVGE